MVQSPISSAIKQICEEKNISVESVIATIEAALAVAYRKDFGEKNQNIKVEFDQVTSGSRVFDVKTVVSDELYAETIKEEEERKRRKEAGEAEPEEKRPVVKEGEDQEEKKERFDFKTNIALSEAKKIKKDAELDEVIKQELFPPSSYGRMAAQTAKQVIIQRLREAERETLFKEYKGREGELLTGTVQRVEGRVVLIDLGRATGIIPPPEQIVNERYSPGQRIKVYLVSVNSTPKGPELIVSRSHPEIVKKLFTMEVPEISTGAIEIRGIAREAGSRTKIAVESKQKNIDPVGSCVGQRGTRVQTVIAELSGEKIDIIEYSDDPVTFISNALSPAKILNVKTNEEEKTALVEVKDDQVSLAIGRNGQNVRLAARLTGWKIDIVSERLEKPTVEEPKPEEPKKEDEKKEEEPLKEEPKKEVKKEKKKKESKDEEKKEEPKEEAPTSKEGPEEKSIES